MNKEELFNAFKVLFPNWAEHVEAYRKIGSRTLAIKFRFVESLHDENGIETSRVFLYVDENNWQFGTKLWRKRPEMKKKKEDNKNE